MIDISVPDIAHSESVIRAAAAGDELACARLVTEHHGAMSRAAFVVAGDVELAQEAVQAAWSIAWRKLGSIREPERLRPWLVAIAANETRRLLKRRNRRTIVELSITPTGNAPDPGERIDHVDLQRALLRLSADERSLLAMCYAAGLDSTQIGQETGMSASGVRSRLARLLDRLRRELGDV